MGMNCDRKEKVLWKSLIGARRVFWKEKGVWETPDKE